MALPSKLKEKLEQAYPEYPQLTWDEVAQLEAYLAAPFVSSTSFSQLQREKRCGVTKLADEMGRRKEFHRYIKRVVAYFQNPSHGNQELAVPGGDSSTSTLAAGPAGAWKAYRAACETLGAEAESMTVPKLYAWLKENFEDSECPLPTKATFARYLSTARKAFGVSRRQPRQATPTRSVHRREDI